MSAKKTPIHISPHVDLTTPHPKFNVDLVARGALRRCEKNAHLRAVGEPLGSNIELWGAGGIACYVEPPVWMGVYFADTGIKHGLVPGLDALGQAGLRVMLCPDGYVGLYQTWPCSWP